MVLFFFRFSWFSSVALELVPSSARSTATAASPLPSQLVPLLGEIFDQVKDSLGKALPPRQKRTALEEAQWEEDSEEGALEREMLMQCELRFFTAAYWTHVDG